MLKLAVFVCGAVVMILEMVGSRVLAPYLGTSILVWTALIGVILGCLSLGSWLGGVAADRKPTPTLLSNLILLAAICTGAIALSKALVLPHLQREAGGIQAGAVLATVILFAPPAVVLGMVSPLATRLALDDPARTGRTLGSFQALGTVGGILGTFLAGFVLIARLGSTNILFVLAVVLALTAVAVRPRRPLPGAFTALAMGLFLHAAGNYDAAVTSQGIHDLDTLYNRILIQPGVDGRTGLPVRTLSTSLRFLQSAMFLHDPEALALDYTKYYKLAPHFAPGMKRMLIIGGAGYSFPKYALAAYPDVSVDVVEIDPGMTRAAREHFQLKDDPRLRVFHEDARTFLNRGGGRYDAILCDAFSSIYSVPFHLTTLEAAQALRDNLAPGGAVLMNLVSARKGDAGRFFASEHATLSRVFPRVLAFGVDAPEDPGKVQNVILAALAGPDEPALESGDPEIAEFLSRRVPGPEAGDQALVLTDEFAPVDYFLALLEIGNF